MQKRAADLQTGDVVELDPGDFGTVEALSLSDSRLILWIVGDKFPVYISPDDIVNVEEKEVNYPIDFDQIDNMMGL